MSIANQISLNSIEELVAWQDVLAQDQRSPVGSLCLQAIAAFKTFSLQFQEYIEQIITDREFDTTKTTAERLRAQFLETLNAYWAPLGEVATQRQVKPYRDHLDEAGDLIQTCLKALNLKLPGALAYFNKITSAKYYPYTNIAFIGMPYTQLATNDWMAIPHELGHYVYWSLGADLGKVRERHLQIAEEARKVVTSALPAGLGSTKSAAAVDTILSWQEEMFCDVIGTQLGGEPFVMSLQRLIQGSIGNSHELVEYDESHPPLCLRPIVRDQTCRLKQGTSSVDWSKFFKQLFSIDNVDALELDLSVQDAKQVAKLPKKILVDMITQQGAPEGASVGAVTLSAADMRPAVEEMTTFLNAQIKNVLQAGIPARAKEHEAFNRLRQLAFEDANRQTCQPYEIVLRPRVLEGGEESGPHYGVRCHGKKHTIPAHYH